MKPRVWLLAVGLLGLAAPALSEGPPAASSSDQAAQRERLREELRGRAASLASALPGGVASAIASALPLPSGATPRSSAAPPLLPGVKVEELARKWRERAATRDARRARHRAELVQQVGRHLSQPAVKAEIERHARRVAELSRIEFLAQNARTGSAREALLARVSKLSQKETQRHRRALQRLTAAPPAPSGSGAAAPAPPARGVSP